jgi:hypothetical protein
MAYSSALETAAALMLILFAGQLLVAMPAAAAAARRSLLQWPAIPTFVCRTPNTPCTKQDCVQFCVMWCKDFFNQFGGFSICKMQCIGQCN